MDNGIEYEDTIYEFLVLPSRYKRSFAVEGKC